MDFNDYVIGGVDKVRELLESGHDINQLDEDNWSLLHYATMSVNLDVISYLLEKGADINVIGEYRNTPLILASEENHIEVVRKLLKSGADANCGNGLCGLALHEASRLGFNEIAKLLLEYGADVNLIDNEADCWTPLHYASYNNCFEIVKLLIEAGADLYSGGEGFWPMDSALDKGNFDIAQYQYELVENEHPGVLGTPLHAAAGLRDVDLITKYLYDFDINQCDFASRSPLHWAVGRCKDKFFQLIIKHYQKTNTGPSSCKEDNVIRVIHTLLDNEADIEARDYENSTPLLFALQWGQKYAAECLIGKGAKINVSDKSGWTPLILAATEKEMLSTLQMLVEHGADMTLTRGSGNWNALDYAYHNNNHPSIAYLREQGMTPN